LSEAVIITSVPDYAYISYLFINHVNGSGLDPPDLYQT